MSDLLPAGTDPPLAERAQRVSTQGISTSERILRATVRRAAAGGTGAVSLNMVAATAGLSKGLVLYHFGDKTRLLASVIEWIARRSTAREARALEGVASGAILDALWNWIAEELARGELRVLAEFTHAKGIVIEDAAHSAALDRQMAAEQTAERVFAAFGGTSRVPNRMLGPVLVAFVDGLATAAPPSTRLAAASATEPGRSAFDVLWLALLGLAD
ncbi:MAG: hypothetical protein NVS4B3_10530 [Gemmatimonadaceae bacterium]